MTETAADLVTAELTETASTQPSGTPRRGDPAQQPSGRKPVSKKNGATYGIRSELIAELCKVDVATARRWKSGVTRMPYTAAVLVSGDLGAFSAHWKGWRIQGDAIISPDGWQIKRDDALTVPLMLGQINALRAEIAKYREWDEKEEQPAPPEQLPQIIA